MSGSISGVSLLAADSRKSLITDVQFYEAYTSTALNRKFKNIIKPGIYSGFNVVPGTGLKVTVTSGNEGGAASVDIDNVQLSVQQILDIDVDIPAGQTTIIALQAFYKFGVKTSQVTDESTVNAAEIVTIRAQQLKDGQIELCRVAVPEGATQITSEMIDTSFRVFRSLGLQLSAELDSEEEGVAANSLAIKKAISFLSGEGVPEALSTLAQLAAAINNDGNFAQTIDKALDLKAPLASPTLTGTPKAPTAAQTVNNTQIATTAFVKAAISALVGNSTPEGLDTLSEFAAALNNDPQFASTMKKALEGKQPLNQTLTDLSGKTVAGILEYLGLGEGSALPVGVPIPWPSATLPAGYLKCNGAQFSLGQYPKLSIAYPSGTLPDLRGVFIRGWDDGRGLDSGRAILSYAADKMRKHTHGFLFGNGDGNQTPAVHEQSRKAAATTYYAVSGSSGVYLTEEGQNETAPCNIAFNYIVRAA